MLTIILNITPMHYALKSPSRFDCVKYYLNQEIYLSLAYIKSLECDLCWQYFWLSHHFRWLITSWRLGSPGTAAASWWRTQCSASTSSSQAATTGDTRISLSWSLIVIVTLLQHCRGGRKQQHGVPPRPSLPGNQWVLDTFHFWDLGLHENCQDC